MYKQKQEWEEGKQYTIQSRAYAKLVDELFEYYESFLEEPEFMEELIELDITFHNLSQYQWDDEDELYEVAGMYVIPAGMREILYWDPFPHIVLLFVSKYSNRKYIYTIL